MVKIMPKSKDTFNKKFRLLCSQESHDEIKWSSDDSSDYENVSSIDKHMTFNQQNRKRKRKRKLPKNISNLDITVIDLTIDKNLSRSEKREETSPILPSQYNPHYTHKSPILCPKFINSEKETITKSPILVLKTVSPIYSPKVKKKLFAHIENVDKINMKSKSSALPYDESIKDNFSLRRHSINIELCNKEYMNAKDQDNEINKENDFSISKSIVKENKNAIKLDDSLDSLKSSKDWKLASKVKSYFDSHFSSESASQVSIQDSLTPKNNSNNNSKTSDDIEIMNTITQINSNRNSTDSVKEESDVVLQLKKIRYKKNGLAYRLNMMLKKHNASISLWQHERFLAANSNFVIPKGEHLVFMIRNVEMKYGCFLLEAKNIENEQFLILIKDECVNNCNIYKDMILKVYEPYKILELYKDYKLVINICKFQGEKLNDL